MLKQNVLFYLLLASIYVASYQVICINEDKACVNPNMSLIYDKNKEQEIKRFAVPKDKLSWNVSYSEYKPIHYESKKLTNPKPIWADEEKPSSKIKFNTIDNGVDRTSFMGQYIVNDNIPQNPVERTGITGRGLLGKWGPNHAADPIVTRWVMDGNKKKVDPTTNKAILEFVAIERADTHEWAIPGGMCDPGEKVSYTMKREFMEEALNSLEMNNKTKNEYKKKLDAIFNKCIEVYRGYVYDPRNTDNAWMETVACNFHDQDNKVFKDMPLRAGDDAKHVKWQVISKNLVLYASHKDFIRKVAKKHNAHWDPKGYTC